MGKQFSLLKDDFGASIAVADYYLHDHELSLVPFSAHTISALRNTKDPLHVSTSRKAMA